jgi:hypothetical protein
VPASYAGVDCAFDVDTSRGSLAQATASMTLTRTIDPNSSGGYRLDPGNMTITGVEPADIVVSGQAGCETLNFAVPFFLDSIVQTLQAQVAANASPICLATPPEVVRYCQ